MSSLALSALFEYLCFGSTAIINILFFTAGIDLRDDNLTSMDVRFHLTSVEVRFRRLKSVSTLNRFLDNTFKK